MATKKAHCLGDIDEIHVPCGGQGVVMRGAKTVTIAGVGVRLAIRGRNSAHAAETGKSKPLCGFHEGFPNVSDVSKTVFAEGRGICRSGDTISLASKFLPCTVALPSIVNTFVFVGG